MVFVTYCFTTPVVTDRQCSMLAPFSATIHKLPLLRVLCVPQHEYIVFMRFAREINGFGGNSDPLGENITKQYLLFILVQLWVATRLSRFLHYISVQFTSIILGK